MKNITADQKAWLLAAADAYRVDLLDMALPNGQIIRAVLGGADDLSYGGATYYATAFGSWSRASVSSEAMRGNLSSKSTSLNLSAPDSVFFPGTSVPMSQSFVAGVWDAAKVTLTTVWMPLGQWGNVQVAMVLFGGMVSACDRTGRSTAKLTVNDWLYLANQQVPKRVIQPSCFNTFGDAACTFALSGIGIANTVAAGFTPTVITPTTAWPPTDSRGNSISVAYAGAGYFANGKLKWTSGENAGFSSHISAQQIDGSLVLAAAPAFPIAAGDGFTVYAGCQKTIGDCTSRWGNQANFGGFPFVPPPEHSV